MVLALVWRLPMKRLLPLGIGAAVGLMGVAVICFDASATGRPQIVVASVLRCMLVALLLAALTPQSSWPAAIGLGAGYGLWTASFVVLSKAESAGQHAAYILLSALATGAVIGAAIRWLGLF
jgi:hypothetical protein